MDLNHLLHRHQTSLMRADAAACGPSRLAHLGLARDYARRINTLQSEIGATVGPIGMPLARCAR